MKNFIVAAVALVIYLTAGAEDDKNPLHSSLERAQASLALAVEDAGKKTIAAKSALETAVKKATDEKKRAETAKAAAEKSAVEAVNQADSMKAAITKAADIEAKTKAALEALKKINPVPPGSALERAMTALTHAVDSAKKETAAKQNAYDAAAKKAGNLRKQSENAKAAADKKAADAAKQAESMKAALTKVADIEKKIQSALQATKLAVEASK